MNIKIIDNAIDISSQNLIIDSLLGNQKTFPWYYRKDITDSHSKNNQHRPALGHYFFLKQTIYSPEYVHLLEPIIKKYINKKIIQCRSFLQFPLNPKTIGKEIDTPHIDSDKPHQVFLYYVVSSDGHTIFYDNNKIIKKVKPQQGRLVIFPGNIYHSAEQPKKDVRCIINFDVNI